MGFFTAQNRFDGMLFCGDCGNRLGFEHHFLKDDKIVFSYKCSSYSKNSKKALYNELLFSAKLNDYLFELNKEAEEMLARLIKQMAENQGITEKLKAEDQMLWVGRMNNIQNSAREIVYNDLIYA